MVYLKCPDDERHFHTTFDGHVPVGFAFDRRFGSEAVSHMQDTNPYTAPSSHPEAIATQVRETRHRGPLLYFAVAAVVGAMLAIPMIVPRSMSVKDNPNPFGYLIILCSFPVGGLIFRIRSRHWPLDPTVTHRQWYACLATLLLPFTVASMTRMGGQGLHMTVLAAFISLVLSSAILIAGRRRWLLVPTPENNRELT